MKSTPDTTILLHSYPIIWKFWWWKNRLILLIKKLLSIFHF